MTWNVTVATADGPLIDPRFSTPFIHERLAQHLCQPRSNKNARVKRVSGTSMPTRQSVWYQVSGVEVDAEKIRVEAYVLMNITKDLYPCIVFRFPSSWTTYEIWSWLTLISELQHTLICCWGLKHSPAFFVMASRLDLEALHAQLILASDVCCLVRSRVAMW